MPAAPSPLTIGVFVGAALAAIVPTAALMALAHGWDGSFAHTTRARTPARVDRVTTPRAHPLRPEHESGPRPVG